ncbi:MAG: CPBP family intramembrane glutamic endopeptidase [Ferruginibacter sp.]
MHQLSKTKSVLFHLYPGLLITTGFILLTPLFMRYGFPPQFGMLLSIILVAVPILFFHLLSAKKAENKTSIMQLNGFTKKLPTGKLILYAVGLVVLAFVIWGATQPLNAVITKQLLSWLPDWYTEQDFSGYGKNKIVITLVFNLVLNGFLAPLIEEIYFRGYLLPRMKSWGRWAFVVNAILFSLYHFWQPYIYVTLILSLLPMTWLVWKTKDLRLAILTHSLLNIIGALLSFGLINK